MFPPHVHLHVKIWYLFMHNIIVVIFSQILYTENSIVYINKYNVLKGFTYIYTYVYISLNTHKMKNLFLQQFQISRI